MGKCIVHMQKVTKAGLRGIQSHMNREHDSKTNPDIDKERTDQNYHFQQTTNLYQGVKQTIEDYVDTSKKIRKDAVHLCSFIVTSDHETMAAMSPATQKRFFKDSVDFFIRRYGAEFIQYATVHMDEYTPHLHLGVVPATFQKDSDTYRLCAKDLFSPKELRALQTAFYENVGRKYGLERGQENSKAKHLTETQYKAQKASEKVQELEAKAEALEAKVTALEARETELVQSIPVMEEQVTEMRQELEVLDKAVKKREDQGGALFGSDWQDRIREIKELDRKERRLSLLEKFIELPIIKPIWERFLQEQTRGRSKSKSTHEWGS